MGVLTAVNNIIKVFKNSIMKNGYFTKMLYLWNVSLSYKERAKKKKQGG